MSRHANEVPMDFQFDNGTGPMDSRSPFALVNNNSRRLPDGVNMSPRKNAQGTQGGFESPSKSRTMGNKQSSPSKPPPGVAAFNSLFSTPRKANNDFDDSSAGETPRSPEPRDDSEVTPEIKNSRSAFTRCDSASAPTVPGAERERSSPSKRRPDTQRRDSTLAIWAKVKNKFNSPGRGEIHRPEHAGAIEKASRRRRREVDRRVARQRRYSMSDSGEDHEPQKSSQKGASDGKPHWAGTFFSFLAEHPSLPQTLSYYAQFIFNVFLLCCCGYLIYCFWTAVLGDVNNNTHQAMADIAVKIRWCQEEFKKNHCDAEKRLPFVEGHCNEMEKCMNDPRVVKRALTSARAFAEIFNSFVEPISYKAMIFTAVMVFGCFGISNFAFGYFRRQPTYGYGYPYGPPPPPTPQRSFSNQDGGFYAGTPWHQPPPGMGFEPQPSGGFGQIDDQGSPQRRLVYN